MKRRVKRRGLRIIGARGDQTVRQALIRYARWLRKHYEFPIRVPVYLKPGETFVTTERRVVSASFFAPFDRRQEPYIRIATGDYQELRRQRGRDNALASFINSLSHELIHYWQWIDGRRLSEAGIPRKADAMLRRYEQSTDRP